MTTTKKRVAAFDVLKGIAIYLVVMGHVLTMCIRDIDSAVLFKLVGQIHMPIFFFISGYFTYKLTGNGDFAMPNLRKRFWQLIIPFLAVSALWMCIFRTAVCNRPCRSRGRNFSPRIGKTAIGLR